MECVSTNPFRCTGEGRPSKALRAGQSVDKDGHPDCLRDGVRVATSFDDNEPRTAKSVTRILGAGMTYDGYIAVNGPGVVLVASWASGGGRPQWLPTCKAHACQ